MGIRSNGLLVVLVLLAAAVSGCGSAGQTIQSADQTGLAKLLWSSFGDASRVLGSITDSTSAENAVPELQGIGDELDDLILRYGDASEANKEEMGKTATDQIPVFQKAVDTAYAIPGVKNVIKSQVDSLMSKFKSF